MTRGSRFALVLAFVCAHGAAMAATVKAVITDANGKPVSGAVVSLMPANGAPLPPPSNIPASAVIDQRHQMFMPLMVVIRRGGQVVFANHDTTMHQVYSFSPIKQFEYEIHQGEESPAVTFDKPGVAAIGCNIHDNMVAFVYVTDSPWTVTTDAQGRAKIDHVPDGAYRASVWHPRLAPGHDPPAADLTVAGAHAALSLSVPLLADTMAGMSHSHRQDY